MTDKDQLNRFANELANKYTAYFDVYRDEPAGEMPMSFIALFKRRDERYMLSKKITIYGVENQQIVYAKVCGEIKKLFLNDYVSAIKKHSEQCIPAHHEHMSTVILGLMITNHNLDAEIIKEVRRFRKLKLLKFGLNGWYEMYLAVIQPEKRKIVIHPKGKTFVFPIEKFLKEGMTV